MTTHAGPNVTFRTTVLLDGRTATGIEVPDDVVEALGAGRQPLVRVTMGGHTYPSRVAVRGGRYKLPVSAENRARAGVDAGDEVDVTLAVDTEPREVAVPDDLGSALAARDLRAQFDALSPSRRRAIVLDVEAARTDDTRRRRLDKAVAALERDAA